MNFNADLWAYACRLYDKPKVKNACMVLQDQFGINTPLLLFCCWRLSKDGAVSSLELTEAKSIVDTIDEPLITPLRTIRRTLKSTPQFSGSQWQEIRSVIADQELAAERLLLSKLEAIAFTQSGDVYEALDDMLKLLYPATFSVTIDPLRQHVDVMLKAHKREFDYD